MGVTFANHGFFGAEKVILTFSTTGVFTVKEAGRVNVYFLAAVTEAYP